MDSFVTPQWSCSADNPLSKYHIESWGAVAPWKVSISPGEVLRRQAPTGAVLAQFRLWSYICTQKEEGYILAPELRVTSWPVPSVQEWSLRTGWQEKLSWHSPAAALSDFSYASRAPPYGQTSLLKGSQMVTHNPFLYMHHLVILLVYLKTSTSLQQTIN